MKPLFVHDIRQEMWINLTVCVFPECIDYKQEPDDGVNMPKRVGRDTGISHHISQYTELTLLA